MTTPALNGQPIHKSRDRLGVPFTVPSRERAHRPSRATEAFGLEHASAIGHPQPARKLPERSFTQDQLDMLGHFDMNENLFAESARLDLPGYSPALDDEPWTALSIPATTTSVSSRYQLSDYSLSSRWDSPAQHEEDIFAGLQPGPFVVHDQSPSSYVQDSDTFLQSYHDETSQLKQVWSLNPPRNGDNPLRLRSFGSQQQYADDVGIYDHEAFGQDAHLLLDPLTDIPTHGGVDLNDSYDAHANDLALVDSADSEMANNWLMFPEPPAFVEQDSRNMGNDTYQLLNNTSGPALPYIDSEQVVDASFTHLHNCLSMTLQQQFGAMPYSFPSDEIPSQIYPSQDTTDFALTTAKTQPEEKAGERGNDLIIIQEDGKRIVSECSSGLKRRGVRHGKLPPAKAVAAAEKRRRNDVCIRCRMNRLECAGSLPCQRCQESWSKTSVQHPCLKAHFLDIIETGSCNYVSQRAINHLTLDENKRIQILMPDSFDLNDLLSAVRQRQGSFSIRRRSMTGSLFVLNLSRYATFLESVSRSTTESPTTFRDFINITLAKARGWTKCVTECDDPTQDVLSLLGIWNNEPCRASYDLVSVNSDTASRPLNVLDSMDREEIILAAKLSRIICRVLELDGYRALQKQINKLRFADADETIRFVRQAGQILLTLRWRLSWWDVHGDGRANEKTDPFRMQYVERVRTLTTVLYFYFFTAKRRISSWMSPEGVVGIWSHYADTLPLWDEFPTEESLEGFERWLQGGKDLVLDAGGKAKMPRFR